MGPVGLTMSERLRLSLGMDGIKRQIRLEKFGPFWKILWCLEKSGWSECRPTTHSGSDGFLSFLKRDWLSSD